jgi:hypothetical protein
MKPRHVLDRLPLWVEGDLPGPESHSIQEHLDLCESCREAAGALRASQAWLKDAPPAPFSDGDRAQLRRDVMALVRAEIPRKPGASRIPALLLMAAAVLCLLAMDLYPRRPKDPLAPGPVARPAIASALPSTLQPTVIEAVRPRPISRRHTTVQPDSKAAAEPAFARMEIQTSNPQIRIIWLARAQPKPTALVESINPT